jgi:hypothetical protein
LCRSGCLGPDIRVETRGGDVVAAKGKKVTIKAQNEAKRLTYRFCTIYEFQEEQTATEDFVMTHPVIGVTITAEDQVGGFVFLPSVATEATATTDVNFWSYDRLLFEEETVGVRWWKKERNAHAPASHAPASAI